MPRRTRRHLQDLQVVSPQMECFFSAATFPIVKEPAQRAPEEKEKRIQYSHNEAVSMDTENGRGHRYLHGDVCIYSEDCDIKQPALRKMSLLPRKKNTVIRPYCARSLRMSAICKLWLLIFFFPSHSFSARAWQRTQVVQQSRSRGAKHANNRTVGLFIDKDTGQFRYKNIKHQSIFDRMTDKQTGGYCSFPNVLF